MNNRLQGSTEDSVGPRFLIIGRVRKPHGVRGEVRVEPHTDWPERFTWLESVYVGETNPQPVAVESARFHKGLVLLKLAGYDGREAAGVLRGEWLQVPEEEAVPLAEGEYYLHQLYGLAVYTDEGEHLGELAQVIETGANHVFEVQGERGEILIPDTDEVVREIDFENGRMTVHLLPGLLR
ncbi:MAG: 16S rRNA processing protein RimM [Chloroflexi bacterium]|nr:16S rRNA processing protein RimM [Chloroflexota bacterium]